MQTWQERCRTKDSDERNLKLALTEINRMGGALGLPGPIRKTASLVYQEALDERLLPGRSIEGVATAALYLAGRQAGNPRTLDEISDVSRVTKQEVSRTYRYLVTELQLKMKPPNPAHYRLLLDENVERRAMHY